MHILVTGGLGFIGSHSVVELVNAGHRVHIVDNLCNSSIDVLGRVKQIVGSRNEQLISFTNVDLLDSTGLAEDLKNFGPFQACIHFAGLKSVGESVTNPELYYRSNIVSTLNLVSALKKQGEKCLLIFSSSATVYGEQEPPLIENGLTGFGITNPYGWTKHFIEQILEDEQRANPELLNVCLLRYFNPVGAHQSGLIGENPKVANNLMPYVQKVLSGEKTKLYVFGNDYPTRDGTCIRDYIHVVDLAKGHLAALQSKEPFDVFNLGTGNGSTVLELVATMEKVSGRKIPCEVANKRQGDLPALFANVDKAKSKLGWTAELSLEDMCRDSWRWVGNFRQKE
jgi:UDP-glucose 4-epimerase